MWQSVDPLAGKYYKWNPYCYVLNNPLRFVDSDGRKVEFAPGTSVVFMKQFVATIKYLNDHHISSVYGSLVASDKVIYIKETKGNSNFTPSNSTINFNPEMGVITTKGVILSPATVFNHEADHAKQEIEHPDQKKKDKNTPDPKYDNKEEKRVITGTEQETAKALGEINQGEVTRNDHGGQRYDTKGPTTTEGKNEVVVYSKSTKKDE